MRRFVLPLLPIALAGCMVLEETEVIPARRPVTTLDVVQMKQAGASDAAVIGEIYGHGVLRKPEADDLVLMTQAGVSDSVIQAMLAAPVTTPREEQVIRRRTVVHHEAGADAVSFGIGALIGWSLWRHSHHHWHYRGCGHRGW